MATVNLSIIIGAVNKAGPVLKAVQGQVNNLTTGRVNMGTSSGRGLAAGLQLAGGAGRILSVVLAGVQSVLSGIGSVASGALSAVREGLQSAWNMARGLVGALMNVAKWAAIAGLSLTAMIAKKSIDNASAMEGYLAKLTTSLKDAAKAQDMLTWSVAFASKTPFSVSEVVDASTRLEMYGLSAKKWLPLVGDMAGSMGKSVTDAVEAVADAVGGGGLERLKEFAINTPKLLAAGAGGTKKGGGAGAIDYQSQAGLDRIKGALETIMARDYGGGMDKMSKTAVGALSNFKDAVDQLTVRIGQALMPAFKRLLAVGMNLLTWLQEMKVAETVGGWFTVLFDKISGGITRLMDGVKQLRGGESFGDVLTNLFGANVAATIFTVIGYVSQAVTWVKATVAGVVSWMGKFVAFLSTNFAALGKWFSYFVQVGEYAVAWAYKRLPDMLDAALAVFGGIARAVLFVSEAVSALKTVWDVVIGSLATVLLGVATVVVGALTGILNGVMTLANAANVLSGGMFGGMVKGLEEARASMWKLTNELAGATKDQAVKVGVAWNEGLDRTNKAEALREKLSAGEAAAQQWSAGVRQKWSNVPEPMMPTAPTGADLKPFGAPGNTVNANGWTFNIPGAGDPQAVGRSVGDEIDRRFRTMGGKWGLVPSG